MNLSRKPGSQETGELHPKVKIGRVTPAEGLAFIRELGAAIDGRVSNYFHTMKFGSFTHLGVFGGTIKTG